MCYPQTVSEKDLEQMIDIIHNAKYTTLKIQSDDRDANSYFNHVRHTLGSTNCLIYVLDDASNSNKFFLSTIRIAIESGVRVYFLNYNSNTDSILNFLKSNDVPLYKLSGITWETDGLTTKATNEGIDVAAPVKYSDVIFKIPLQDGKWYYEATLAINGNGLYQIGWANELMDMSIEVFHHLTQF